MNITIKSFIKIDSMKLKYTNLKRLPERTSIYSISWEQLRVSVQEEKQCKKKIISTAAFESNI